MRFYRDKLSKIYNQAVMSNMKKKPIWNGKKKVMMEDRLENQFKIDEANTGLEVIIQRTVWVVLTKCLHIIIMKWTHSHLEVLILKEWKELKMVMETIEKFLVHESNV